MILVTVKADLAQYLLATYLQPSKRRSVRSTHALTSRVVFVKSSRQQARTNKTVSKG
jgi:hypothetical protein